MIEVETLDQHHYTWSSIFEASLILNDSFRDDFMRDEYWPSKYNLATLPSNLGYNQLLQYNKFKIVVDHFARFLTMNIRNNSRYRLMIFRDSSREYGNVVGMAALILPEYYKVPTSSIFYKLKSFFLSIVYKLSDLWAFYGLTNPLHPPEMVAEFGLGNHKCNTLPTEDRITYLRTLKHQDLEKEHYPKAWSYYLSLFAVGHNEQGKGTGKKMMGMLLNQLKNEFGIIEPPVGGPAKLQLFSSPAGLNFYKRYGFTLAAQYPSKQPSGRMLEHSFLYMNLT